MTIMLETLNLAVGGCTFNFGTIVGLIPRTWYNL
jgi:hypothetical protein